MKDLLLLGITLNALQVWPILTTSFSSYPHPIPPPPPPYLRSDIKRAHRVASKLQAGYCWVNNYNVNPWGLPFGGYKQSGLGRENALDTINDFTQLKSVYVEMGDIDCPYWATDIKAIEIHWSMCLQWVSQNM